MKPILMVLLVDLCIFYSFWLKAQDTSIALTEVVVTGISTSAQKQTSMSISTVNLEDNTLTTRTNCTQILNALPGVQTFSTSNAINKPMVRGLYGNRVLVLYNGLKLDNQQWQNEHGLGISSLGIQRIELIKGPASVLYGSEAIGGVINILDQPRLKPFTQQSTCNMLFNSNDLHTVVNLGFAASKGSKWHAFYLGAESAADYSDGDHNRVLNSRYNGLFAKANFGFKKKGWLSQNSYYGSFNRFGFVFNDMSKFFDADQRWSMQMTGPHHKVLLNMFSSQNQKLFNTSKLEVDFGAQSNFRAEDEGGGALNLMMHLANMQERLKYTHYFGKGLELVINQFTSFETNRNYGRRKLVPNANIFEFHGAAFLRKSTNHFVYEAGWSQGAKGINALLTPQLNSTEKEIEPFKKSWFFPNAMLGVAYNPNHHVGFKLNVSSGVRAPNLAELSSNGLHEGIYTYELGDPNLKAEKNLNLSFELAFVAKSFGIEAAVFQNRFHNFIYLKPTNRDWFGFPVFEYVQQNALLKGFEIDGFYQPPILSRFKLSTQISYVTGSLQNGASLPYMPPFCLKPKIEYSTQICADTKLEITTWSQVFSAQQKLAAFEKATPGYALFNCIVGVQKPLQSFDCTVSLGCENLFNQHYYSHLSRIKNFGYNNMGRTFFIRLKITSSKNLKT